MPKSVAAIGEIDPCLTHRNIKAVQFHGPQKRHLDIDIILIELVDPSRFPHRHILFRDNCALELELRWRAPADTSHLPDPAGCHLVAVLLDGNAAMALLHTALGRKTANNRSVQQP